MSIVPGKLNPPLQLYLTSDLTYEGLPVLTPLTKPVKETSYLGFYGLNKVSTEVFGSHRVYEFLKTSHERNIVCPLYHLVTHTRLN